MKISEVFATVQGEGLLSGVPSLFIRTSGCNLRCHWCDTPYTSWTPEGADWTVERLIDWARGFPSYRHVVVTGGEPMIQPQLPELTRRLREAALHVTIETAGTVDALVECDLMSLSPKLANSTPWERDRRWAEKHEALRIQGDVLARLTRDYDYQLKFVVCEERDLEEIGAIQAMVRAPAERVLLMPEGTEPGVLHERSQWLVEVCKRTGYRFCPRIHVLLWGAKRGV